MNPLPECFDGLRLPLKTEPTEFQTQRCVLNKETYFLEISSSSSDEEDTTAMEAEIFCPVVRKRPNPSDSVDSRLCNFSVAKMPRIHSNQSNSATDNGRVIQFQRQADHNNSLPEDFLEPLEAFHVMANPVPVRIEQKVNNPGLQKPRTDNFARQFWKAGDYDSTDKLRRKAISGMDHVRVHPKFLHSNATSHKWALGAIAELLDNAVDEVVHGATFVKIDTPRNPKKNEPMLFIEDDGGGMRPDDLRHCMSLGYSLKSKLSNTIGQYGNGFKTSTMRLGADVIVFTRSQGQQGSCPTQSIGLLSYTFLRETGQEDIIVPMVDYEILPFGLRKLVPHSIEDWNKNMESITRWSPYSTESDLLKQFADMKNQGTKVVVFNLWEDDEGQLELDLDADPLDIQVRSKRDRRQVSLAEKCPNSWHYLTYQHSLRTYASILYLKLPQGFKMFLRGKEIEHHNIVDDLMHTQLSTYRPQVAANMHKATGEAKAVVTIGFVKDATEHIDVQGFNVYHKNRLIKPFWRLWNSGASRGRGIIGVLEANFVEPAHDKQGFERTIVLARLEARLIEMQKTYWTKNCHKVGYVNNSLKDKNHQSPSSVDVGKQMDCNIAQPATFTLVPRYLVQNSALPNLDLSSTGPGQAMTSVSNKIALSSPRQVTVLNLSDRSQPKHISSNVDASISVNLPAASERAQQFHAQTQSAGKEGSSHHPSLRNSIESRPFCQMFLPSSRTQKQDSVSLALCSMQSQQNSVHQSTLHQTKKVPVRVQEESQDIRSQDHHSDSARCAAEDSGNVAQECCTQERNVAEENSQKLVVLDNLSGAIQVNRTQDHPPGQIVNMNTSSAVESVVQTSTAIDRLVQRSSAPNTEALRSAATATAGSVDVSMQRQSTFEGLSVFPHSLEQKDQIIGVGCERVQDHSHVKESTNNEDVMHDSRRSLEDLGCAVVKRALLRMTNKEITASDALEEYIKPSQDIVTDSRRENELGKVISVTDSNASNNKTVEVQIVDMELEIQSLQGKLEKAIAERDELKQQLVEERIQGQRRREALQKALGETLAALKKLEAHNYSLRLAHSTPFRIS